MKTAQKIWGKIESRLTRVRRDTGWHLGLNRSFLHAEGGRILVYHGVCKNDPFRFNTLFVTLKTFEEQLVLYKKHFNMVSLDDFYSQRFSKDKFTICLTFDDGFANNYQNALPLLEQYKVPAAFFITGISNVGYNILWNDALSIASRKGPQEFVFRDELFYRNEYHKYISSRNGRQLNDLLREEGFEPKKELLQALSTFHKGVDEDYWLQMTPDQIRKLSDSKWVTIGSHGYYHNDLAQIPLTAATDELICSKEFLENTTGKEVKALAFPYGSYTMQVVAAAKTAGFSQLLATEFLYSEEANDPAMRERLTINPFISHINQMHANITGHYI